MAFNTPSSFVIPEDICNRALQHVGARRIVTLGDNSREANSVRFIYDKVRRAELRRNPWVFSTRRAPIRPIQANTTATVLSAGQTPNTGTLFLTPSVWNGSVTYTPGAIVTDPTVPGLIWTSLAQENLNNAPGEGSVWDVYFGPMTVQPYDSTVGYWAGELVYVRDPNTQAVTVYRSLANSNGFNNGLGQSTAPNLLTDWSPTVVYGLDQVVSYGFLIYRSAAEQNVGNVPLGNSNWLSCGPVDAPTLALASNIFWLPIQATISSRVLAYPIGAGPVQEQFSRNVFPLPNGFLKMAAQDPTAGSVSYLGAPGGLTYRDWVEEAGTLTSRENTIILLRFIADITNVSLMDDMFCEGLGCRIGLEIAEEMTQASDKKQDLERLYKQFMSEARIVNAIESGSDQPPEDDYISCRQ
jgi:hypothetical protein